MPPSGLLPTHARSPAGKSTGRRLQQNRRYNRKLYLRFHADNRAAAGAGAAATPDPLQAAGAAAPVTQSAGAGHPAPPPNHRVSPPAADPPARRPAGLLAAAHVSAHGGAGPTSDARVAAAVHHFSSTARAAGRAEALEFAAAICALVSEQDALFVFAGRRAVSTYVSGGPARPRPGLARPARPRRPGSGPLRAATHSAANVLALADAARADARAQSLVEAAFHARPPKPAPLVAPVSGVVLRPATRRYRPRGVNPHRLGARGGGEMTPARRPPLSEPPGATAAWTQTPSSRCPSAPYGGPGPDCVVDGRDPTVTAHSIT